LGLYSTVQYQQRTHCDQHAFCGGPHSTCPPNRRKRPESHVTHDGTDRTSHLGVTCSSLRSQLIVVVRLQRPLQQSHQFGLPGSAGYCQHALSQDQSRQQ
jgi:hypothetical protein